MQIVNPCGSTNAYLASVIFGLFWTMSGLFWIASAADVLMMQSRVTDPTPTGLAIALLILGLLFATSLAYLAHAYDREDEQVFSAARRTEYIANKTERLRLFACRIVLTSLLAMVATLIIFGDTSHLGGFEREYTCGVSPAYSVGNSRGGTRVSYEQMTPQEQAAAREWCKNHK